MTRFAKELGQLFMVGLPGTCLDDSTVELIEEYGINNFIIFRRNVESPGQLASLCVSLRQACLERGLAPPLISIDQEGGTVARLRHPFTEFEDARLLAEADNAEELLSDYARTCARELLEMGINCNLAPVLDVAPRGRGLFMERRALGGEPEVVARLGILVIRELQERGVAACGKHFPGLGAAVVDPHKHLPVVERPVTAIRQIDLPPFAAAIQAGVGAIMTSHTLYPALDPENPATLSEKILSGLLRGEMGYEGVIVTDDLEMGAIENEMELGVAALQAFRAGADLLLICEQHGKVRDSCRALREALAAGVVQRPRIDRSIERIARLRARFVA